MMLPAMDTRIDVLLEVLDRDIRHIETTLSRLDTLRTLLVKRDDGRLERLLDDIRRQAERYSANEQERQALRRDLAAALGCGESELTLSKLGSHLSQRHRAAMAERQGRLKSLVARLRHEYTLTSALISDCARFNRALVQVLFGSSGNGTMTYGASGATKHRTDAALMSLRL